MKQITIALAKGRLAEKAMDILEKCGVDCTEPRNPGRRLVLHDAAGHVRFILVKPSDVPTYVERGVADMGVVGKDTLLESDASLYELLDLGFGRCKLCVCGFPDRREQAITHFNLRVATKYPKIAREYFESRGQSIDIIKLNGSVELGPLIGLSDVILDIVESGGTLRANGLAVLEEIVDVSARVVVNRVSLKTRGERIRPLIEAMRQVLKEDKPS